MTIFVSTRDVQHHLKKKGLAHFYKDLLVLLQKDFCRWEEFDKTPRMASHSKLGVIELMPISDHQYFTFKYVNGHPKNTHNGLLTVAAFGVLSDVLTGYPILISELTLITAIRTAATSVLAAKYLARPDSKIMALIGNGAQSEFQAIAFHTQLGINTIHAYDIDEAATDKLIKNLAQYPELTVKKMGSTAQALQGADIVTTVTADKKNAIILKPEMIEPGMHINAVGGDCPGKTELDTDILWKSRVFVEFEPQSRVEGELQQMPAEFIPTELWRVIKGQLAGRHHDSDITVFDSVGFALEDFSALNYIYQYLVNENSTHIDLIPALENPKDLYGFAIQPKTVETVSVAQHIFEHSRQKIGELL